jgi:SAM-dependent methyltransferase
MHVEAALRCACALVQCLVYTGVKGRCGGRPQMTIGKSFRRLVGSDLEPISVAAKAGLDLARARLLRTSSRSFRMDNAVGLGICQSMIDLRDKAVLEIGGALPRDHALSSGCRSWIGTDIKESRLHEGGGGYSTQLEDATDLSFDSDRLDVVFSISALEHIPNPRKCLREVARVLKPGGYFFSTFGPIWSGPIGHHVWFKHGGRLYDFHGDLLAPWEHLLSSPREMQTRLERAHGAELAAKAVEAAFTDGNNQELCDTYLSAIHASGMYVNHLVKRRIKVPNSDETQRRLRALYPSNTDFETSGIRVLLQKPLTP